MKVIKMTKSQLYKIQVTMKPRLRDLNGLNSL